MAKGSWQAVDPSYDSSHLAADTMTLLSADTPVIVRMETLRRATVYAARNPISAAALLDALEARAGRSDRNAGHAVFDFGYLVETYKQAAWMAAGSPAFNRAKSIDGYMLVQKARTLTDDQSMAFALVAIGIDKTHGVSALREHIAQAREAAKTDPAVRANLATHWSDTTAQYQ
jgi:hypothetical protein